ncbi:MAG: inorganic phosphate transporter [Zestosphaera sp.]
MIPWLLVAGLVTAACLAWSIGANDMANSTSILVGSNVLKFKHAFMLFLTFQLMGAMVQGYMVMKTLGKGIVPEIEVVGALSASLSAFIWITIATVIGAPISTTHSVTGAVIGVGLAYVFSGAPATTINIYRVRDIILSWIISPVAAMVLTVPLYHILRNLKITSERGYKIVRALVLFFAAFAAYSFGANDVANATGVYVSVTSASFGLPSEDSMRLLALYASLFIGLGGFTLGYRVINTLAYKVTRLDLMTALAAGFANAFTVWLFTTVPYLLFGYGLPISTTYVAAGSIVGVGLAKSGWRGVNVRTVFFIITSWLLTLPIAAGLSLCIYYLVSYILGVGF